MFSVTRRRVGGPSIRTAGAGAVSAGVTPRQANCGPSSSGSVLGVSGAGGSGSLITPVRERLERGTVVHDWIPRDTRTLNRLVRLIYLTDPVIGPAIDFYREVPFGPVILGGIKDAARLRFYNDALEAIKLQRFLPFLAGDLLTVGRLITHLLLNESKGFFDHMIVHDSDYVMVQPSPIIGQEPIIDLMVPPNYQQWATNPDPRYAEQRRLIDKQFIRLMAAGATIPLSSENTIFVPRRASSNDDTGTSLIMRAIPIVAIDWSYLQAEATGLRRRAAPWTIVKAGIEDKWEPSPEEMQAIQDMLVAAEEDPVGAKLVFRNGIELEQQGSPSDTARWTEQWATLKEAKLQALGMNEAFATGEASWSYLESMLSLGMERIRNFRMFVASEVIQEGILAPLARMHGFYRRSQAEIDHRVRTSSKSDETLDVPTVEWSRSLQPTADRDYLDILSMLAEKGLPIPLRKWAQSAGFDVDEAIEGMPADIELRKQVAGYNKKVKDAEGSGEGGEEEMAYGAAAVGRIVEKVAELPHWGPQNEFMTLSRGELPRMATFLQGKINGKKPGMREWRQIEASMRDSGIKWSKIRAFQYLLKRADTLDVPLPTKTVVKVRDHFLSQNSVRKGVPDRQSMQELYWLNHELERQQTYRPEEVVASATPTKWTAPWARPVTPKLLTGEGWDPDK